MINWITNLIERLKHLFKWLPVIWKDKDWDHFYIYEILKFKIQNQANHIQANGLTDFDREYERMQTILKLLDRVQNEYYIEQLILADDVELTNEKLEHAYKQHDKAKNLVFKLIAANIEKWWD